MSDLDHYHGYQIEAADLDEQPTLTISGTVDSASISRFVGAALDRVRTVLEEAGIVVSGPPFAHFRPGPLGSMHVEAGFAVVGAPPGRGDVELSHLPAGPVLRTVHRGSRARARLAHAALHRYANDHAMTPVGDAWEVYLDDPTVAVPRTLVVLPTHPPG